MSELIADVEAVVLATPGVLALYRTGSTVANAVGEAAELLNLSEDAAKRVVIVQSEDRTEVDIAIGIDSGSGAVELVQTVRGLVEALLVERGQPAPFVRLTVVHIADGRPLSSLA